MGGKGKWENGERNEKSRIVLFVESPIGALPSENSSNNHINQGMRNDVRIRRII